VPAGCGPRARAARALCCGALLAAAPGLSAQPEHGRLDDEPNQQSGVVPVIEAHRERSSFLDGSKLVLRPRSYLLDRNRDSGKDSVGLALGGALAYQSGWWLDRLRFAATGYTSQKLYGPSDKDGTLLFKPGQESFSVLGEANVTLRLAEDTGIRLGRQRLELPYLGSHDIRMVPNTFEALAIGNVADTGLAYMAGYVDRIKRKNDDDFVSMSEAAGAAGSDEGLGFAGARYKTAAGGNLGAIYQHSFETFSTLYATAEYPFVLDNETTLKAFLQYTDQGSHGDALIGDFDTSMVSAKLELRRGLWAWRLAASSTDDEKGIQKPYGNPANYLSVIVDDFDRAGEDAWLAGLSYDFQRVGAGDLSLFANVVSGDTPDSGSSASPDETEYDLTLDYRLRESWAEGLWMRVRGAYIDQDEDLGGDDFFDFRIILNYEFDLL
jgi:hypothetical protein